MTQWPRNRRSQQSLWLLVAACTLTALHPAFSQQDWFRTGTGLGVEKARVAVADFAPRAPAAKSHADLFSESRRLGMLCFWTTRGAAT